TDADTGGSACYAHVDKGRVEWQHGVSEDAARITEVLHIVFARLRVATQDGVVCDVDTAFAGTAVSVETAPQTDVTTPTNTECLVEADVRFDDPRLDHDLTHRDIQLGHGATQLIPTILGFQRDDAAGAVVDGDGTTLPAATGDGGKQGGDVRRLGVVHLNQLTAQRCQLGDLLLGLQLLALARSNFFGRSNQQYVADLTLVQTLGAEHQIQRLVPWHVLQAQGDAAF